MQENASEGYDLDLMQKQATKRMPSRKQLVIFLVLIVAAAALLVFGVVQTVRVERRNDTIAALSSDLAGQTDRAQTLEEQKTTLTAELQQAASSLDQVKGQLDESQRVVEQKSAELLSINEQLAAVQDDLSAKQAQLRQAEQGVNLLEQIDAAYTDFEGHTETMLRSLDLYDQSYQAGDYTQADVYADQYAAAYEAGIQSYERFMQLMQDFRDGNY